jgi:hypothetical protein
MSFNQLPLSLLQQIGLRTAYLNSINIERGARLQYLKIEHEQCVANADEAHEVEMKVCEGGA